MSVTSKSLIFCFTLTCGRRPTAAAKQSSSATRQNAKRERTEESVDARAADGRVGRALRSRGEHHFCLAAAALQRIKSKTTANCITLTLNFASRARRATTSRRCRRSVTASRVRCPSRPTRSSRRIYRRLSASTCCSRALFLSPPTLPRTQIARRKLTFV